MLKSHNFVGALEYTEGHISTENEILESQKTLR